MNERGMIEYKSMLADKGVIYTAERIWPRTKSRGADKIMHVGLNNNMVHGQTISSQLDETKNIHE